MNISPLAGHPAPPSRCCRRVEARHGVLHGVPDPTVQEQRVAFGTSGHRGSSFAERSTSGTCSRSAQAICRYRTANGIDGPLFLGIDTHALSEPALRHRARGARRTRRGCHARGGDEYTPTPAVSHAILCYNRGRTDRPRRRHRDHAVAQSARGRRLQVQPAQRRARRTPASRAGSRRRPTSCSRAGSRACSASRTSAALRAPTTHRHDYLDAYVRISAACRHGRDPRRGHSARRRSARRRRRPLLGARSPIAIGSNSPSSATSWIRPSAS